MLFAAYVEYRRLTDRVKEFADVSTCCSNSSNMCFFAAIMDTTLKWSLNTILYSSFRRFEPALHRFSLLLPVVCALTQATCIALILKFTRSLEWNSWWNDSPSIKSTIKICLKYPYQGLLNHEQWWYESFCSARIPLNRIVWANQS